MKKEKKNLGIKFDIYTIIQYVIIVYIIFKLMIIKIKYFTNLTTLLYNAIKKLL